MNFLTNPVGTFVGTVAGAFVPDTSSNNSPLPPPPPPVPGMSSSDLSNLISTMDANDVTRQLSSDQAMATANLSAASTAKTAITAGTAQSAAALNAATNIATNVANAGVESTRIIMGAQAAAAQAAANQAMNASDNQRDILMRIDDNDTKQAISQAQANVSLAAISSDTQVKTAAINATTVNHLSTLNAQAQSHALDQMASNAKYAAAVAADANQKSQMILANSSQISQQTQLQLADNAIKTLSESNRINSIAQQSAAESAAENQIKMTQALLGPNGVQGLLGTQANALQDQQAQFMQLIYQTQKLQVAQKMAEQQAALPTQPSELEESKRQGRIAALQELAASSQAAITGIKTVAALQAKNPELLNRPTSEILSAIVADVITKTSQDCRGGFDATMKVIISGSGNSIINNKIIQQNKFNSTCLQDVSKIASMQASVAKNLKSVMATQRPELTDQLGLDQNEMSQKINDSVKQTITSETIQTAMNQANATMDIQIGGTDNIVQDNIIQQSNDILFEVVQKEVAKMDFIQNVSSDIDSKIKSDKIVSEKDVEQKTSQTESKTTSPIAAIAAIAAFVAFIVFAIAMIIFFTYKSSARTLVSTTGGYDHYLLGEELFGGGRQNGGKKTEEFDFLKTSFDQFF